MISRIDYKTECNLIDRPNVINVVKPGNRLVQTNYHLFLALNNLTLSKPNWRFKAYDSSSNSTNQVLTAFEISEDDERLGSISIEYKGRGDRIKVRNDRIDAKRERGSGYFTEDPSKAELAIRKHFFVMAKDERLDKAVDTAKKLVRDENRDKMWTKNRARNDMLSEVTDFARKNLAAYLNAYPQLKPKHEEYLIAKAEARTTKSVEEALDKAKAMVVVCDGTQYLTKTGDEIKVYKDEDLSFDLRRKIGLLKLVQDRQMISDVGCRVDNTTFVLLPEVKEQSDEN